MLTNTKSEKTAGANQCKGMEKHVPMTPANDELRNVLADMLDVMLK